MIDGIAGTIFTTGDNVYPNGTAAEFATCYEASWGGSIKARTRPAPGNHDWNAGNLNGYNGYFGASATDADGKSYYSFDIGSAWHVTVLDSECAMVVGGCVATSPQVDWLRADLAANASRNVIVVFHKPRFSSAVTNLAAMQPFWDVSYQYGVDIILVGHDHVYERFAPMAPNGTADPTFGVRQFTVGTGGAAAQSFGTILSTSQMRSPSQTYGVMKLTLHATTYDWLFLPIAGSNFTDSGTGSVHAAPNGEPTFDQNLPNRTDAEGANIDLDAGATDPNGDPLTYEASNLPAGLSINAMTGRITGTIAFTAAASSPYAVSITVRDGASVDATDTFTWTVTNTNQPPTANATSATTNEEVPVAVALSGSDPDTCELTFSIVTPPTKGSLGSIGASDMRRGRAEHRLGQRDVHPEPQRDRCGFVHLPGLRRHDELDPGDRVADDQPRRGSPDGDGRDRHDDDQRGHRARADRARDRPRDVRADVQPAGHDDPGRDPRRDQPAGLRGGQPEHRHGQPDLHPAGRTTAGPTASATRSPTGRPGRPSRPPST